MRLIDDLRSEHDLIEQVVGSFRTFVDLRVRGEADPSDGARFLRFFRLFAGDFHHAREEDTLFVALERQADLPRHGPIEVLLDDHRRMAGTLNDLEPLIGRPELSEGERARLRELAVQYSHALWHHIDAENSVLLPESEGRLLKKGVRELPSREMTAAEQEAKAVGEELLRRYPPSPDAAIVRGDGCVSCRGLEREWWNEWEWAEFEDHLGGE